MPDDGLPAAPDLALLRDIAAASAAATLVLFGPALRILVANAAVAEAVGAPAETLLGRTAATALAGLRAGHLRLLDRLRAGGRARRWRRVPLRLGAAAPARPFAVEVAPLRGTDGRAWGLFLQLRPAPAPDDARATLDALFEDIPEGLILADAPDARIRRVSAFGLRQVNRAAADVVGREAGEHPADWQVFHLDGTTPARAEELPLTRAVRRGEVVQHERWMLRRPDGSAVTILCSAGPIRGAGRRIAGGILAWRDVSDAHRTEAALAASEARYRALAEAGAQAVWTTGPRGGLRRIDDWTRLTGQPKAEAEGDGWLDAVHPEDRERVWQRWQASLGSGAIYAAEYRLLQAAGGGYRWTAARAVPVRAGGEGGPVVEWVGVNSDIHARKCAEEALRASQERFRTLAEAMPHLVWQTDATGAPEYMNQRMLAYTGRRAGSGRHAGDQGWLATVHAEDAPPLARAWEAALAEAGEFDVDARLRAPEGGWRWFRIRAAPVRDEAGAVCHWVGTCTDVEDRRRAEAAAHAALAAQEALARTAEHRIKNSLQLVASLLRLKAGRMGEGTEARAALEAAVARVQAVAEAHRALQKSPDMRSVRVADMLAELAAGAGVLRPGADLRSAADPSLMLEADSAIPLALLLSELVTGALAAGAPALALAAAATAEGVMTVTVDGLPAWPPPAGTPVSSLAETVVRALARQIGATLGQEAAAGRVRVTVTLPAERRPA